MQGIDLKDDIEKFISENTRNTPIPETISFETFEGNEIVYLH